MSAMKAPVVLLFVGALLLGVGTFTKSWYAMSERGFSLHAGLRSAEMCGMGEGDECKSITYVSEIKNARRGKEVAMAISGLIAFIMGMIAMILAAITAGTSLNKPANKTLGVLTIVA